VEIAVKDDDSHRFVVPGLARHYGKTAHAAARCKFPVDTRTDALSVTIRLQSANQSTFCNETISC